MKSNNRIIFNTAITYAQLIVTTILGLFVTRYVLLALGEEDYGVYMLVAGVVSMLNIFSSSMSHASMRYLGHSLGGGDIEEVRKTFNTSMLLHIGLGVFLIILLEVGGWIMFEFFLNIPLEKIPAARIIYQFMIVTTFVTIVSLPFDSVINAHENLLFLSLMQILDMVLRLVASLFLLARKDLDNLVLYGLFMMIIPIIMRLIKQVYSVVKYQECSLRLKFYNDKALIKSMLSFTGWELFGTISAICQGQLRAILINMFFGVRLNSGEGIAKKVNSHVNVLSVGITKAITPQMNKSEGSGDRNRMIRLTLVGIKYTTFMFALLAVPIYIEADHILSIWLDQVPTYAVIFCQLCLAMQLLDKFTWQITNALRSVGKIKEFQVFAGISSILGVGVSYLVFSAGMGPTSIFFVEIAVILINGLYRLYLGKKEVGINIKDFVLTTTVPVLIPIIIGLLFVVPIHVFFPTSVSRILLVLLVFVVVSCLCFYYIGISKSERRTIMGVINESLRKITHRQ